MLVFKACGECDNVVECPHTPKYNEEISYLIFAQKNFTVADVTVQCQYFIQSDKHLYERLVENSQL